MFRVQPPERPAPAARPADCEATADARAQATRALEERERPWRELVEKAKKVCTLGTARSVGTEYRDARGNLVHIDQRADIDVRACPAGSPKELWDAANCPSSCGPPRSDEERALIEKNARCAR